MLRGGKPYWLVAHFLLPLLLLSCGGRGSNPIAAPGEVFGKVVFGDGSPAVGATVQLIGSGSPSVPAASDGSFLFPTLPASSYQLTISMTGFQTITSSFTLAAGQSKDLGTFTLQVASKQKLAQAWTEFESGQFTTALTDFTAVLTASDATSATRAEAYLGIGWSTFLGSTTSTKNSDALASFNSALNEVSNDLDSEAAKVQVLVLLALSSQDLNTAITLGLDVLARSSNYAFSHLPTYNAADLHALVGRAYLLISTRTLSDPNVTSAQQQTQAALTLEPTHPFALETKNLMQLEKLWT